MPIERKTKSEYFISVWVTVLKIIWITILRDFPDADWVVMKLKKHVLQNNVQNIKFWIEFEVYRPMFFPKRSLRMGENNS